MNRTNGRTVVGVFRSRAAADACFTALLGRGYFSSDINVMMTDHTRDRDYAYGFDEEEFIAAGVGGNDPEYYDTTTSNSAPRRATGTAAGSMATQGVGVGGSIGVAVGATLAAIAAVGTSLVIPGLNLIVAGPLLAAFAGGGAGAVAGGLVGGLVGLGIPEQDAQVYQRVLQDGGIVMGVATDAEHVREIENLMIEHSGEQVTCANC